MRVLHVIPSLSPKHGGPSMALPAMARALDSLGISVDVATTDDDGPGCRISGIPLAVATQHEGFRVFYFPKQTEFYKVSLPLLRWLFRHVADYDAVHVHGVFSFSMLAAGWSSRIRHVPYIVRPLGVLNSWGMANRRRWIKALSFRLLDKPVLDHAAAIHYTSRQEEAEVSRLGIRSPGVVIPLGIDLRPYQSLPSPELFTKRFPEIAGRPLVLFLSRLDPKKNVELLLEAMRLLLSEKFAPSRPAPLLVIAGSGSPDYTARLKARASELGLDADVLWAGHLEGLEKLASLAAAAVFVLPSYSENFGIVLLEAMASGLPCIASDQVALAAEVAAFDAVELVPCEPSMLARSITGQLDNPERSLAMGRRAAERALQSYSLQSMADALKNMYAQAMQKLSQS